MTEYLIPELNQRLEDFREYFLAQSSQFTSHVKFSTERFTERDREDFEAVLAEIREFALDKILNFINSRIVTKTSTFTGFFDQFANNTESLSRNLDDFRVDLEQASRKLKEKQIQSEQLLQKITNKYSRMETLKKGFRAFKDNAQQNLKQKKLEQRMTSFYQRRLQQKTFFPWRALTYKDGFENSVKRHTQAQLRRIHTEFGGIVDVLKQKISETEELIKIKRSAKGEFAYALSKNLLKTISNLSLEVMSLNQVAAKDKQSEEQTQNFMNEVNRLINTRLETVSLYKQSIYEVQRPAEIEKVYDLQEPREIPNRVASPKSRGKKISFA